MLRQSRVGKPRAVKHCRDLTDPQLEGLVAEACWRHEHRRCRRRLAQGFPLDKLYNRTFFHAMGRPRSVTVTCKRWTGRRWENVRRGKKG